ncbi:MAG: hypothetical protein A4E57_00333 [Syntrophorhabdaceae bacterium PtaU1.Bin034]|nr:MAG: hypothetical protein A4E57_00333 [Syntrophorhabdaceae bacterium PtaU1.Bin034]
MKRLAGIVAMIVAAIWVTGCAQSVRQIDAVAKNGTKGVFTEVTNGIPGPGKVDLIVRLSIKTHLPGYYLLESRDSLRGKPGYPFIVTIDGQSAVWREDGEIEKTPTYDAEGIRAPEGGDGRRYVLEKRLRLTPGNHRVEIDLPEESLAYKLDLTLPERNAPYFLELKPVYRRFVSQRPTFLHGVSRLEPFLDGVLLSRQPEPFAFHFSDGYCRNENKVDERKDLFSASLRPRTW